MNKSNDTSRVSNQEFLARELESWQKQYYDDVYSLYEKRDEQRLIIAFNQWEDRFLRYLEETLPRLTDVYKTQTSQFMPLTFFGGSLQNFKTVKSDLVEAFLTQSILDSRKGNLDSYYLVPEKKEAQLIFPRNKKAPLARSLTFIFITIPKIIGRLLFDIIGRDKAAQSSTVIIGYIIIIIAALLLLGILNLNSLISFYNQFQTKSN